MLLVVLLKDKPEPLQLVESDAVASIVVNAIKNKQYDNAIFSGNSDNLKNLSQMIKGKIYSTNQDTKSELNKLAESIGCKQHSFTPPIAKSQDVLANLMFEGLSKIEAAKLLSHVLETNSELKVGSYTFGCKDNSFYDNCLVTAALPEGTVSKEDWEGPNRSPGKTTYPEKMNMTDMNKKCWQFVIKNYGTKIKSTFPDSFGRQWIMAMIIYQRVCLAKKLRPWMIGQDMGNATQSIRDRLVLEDEKADVAIDEVFTDLQNSKLASRLEDLRFWGVEEKANTWVVKFARKMIVPANVVATEVFDHLKFKGWLKLKDKACIELSSVTDLILVKEENCLRFFVQITLPNRLVKDLLGEQTQDIEKSLTKLMNVWMETGKLKFRKKDLSA